MELKLAELLDETSIKNKNLILRQFRLYDAYKNPQNPQALQSLISDLAPKSTPGVVQTIITEVFRIPWYYRDTIERAMRHNPAIFNPNNYPADFGNPSHLGTSSFGTGFTNPNPMSNPNFNPGPNPHPNMAQDNPQPFWIAGGGNNPYANPYSPYSNSPNNGGLTAADVKQLITEEFDRREREQREKERQEYIEELEKKVDRLEREKRDLEKGNSSSGSSGSTKSFMGSKLSSGGSGDYDLTNPIDVLKFFNDFSDQMNKLGFAPNSNSGGNSRPLNSNDVEMERLNNQLKMKQEDRKAMEKGAETIAKGLENVASNFGYGFGMAMGNTGTRTRTGTGPRGSGAGTGTRVWIEGDQIVGLCPRCGSRIQAPTNTTKITCRNCNTVIYDKEAQREREATAGAGAGGE